MRFGLLAEGTDHLDSEVVVGDVKREGKELFDRALRSCIRCDVVSPPAKNVGPGCILAVAF